MPGNYVKAKRKQSEVRVQSKKLYGAERNWEARFSNTLISMLK
jgi:hypothetical protein